LSFKVTAVFILALQNDVYVNHISEVSAVLMREKVEKLLVWLQFSDGTNLQTVELQQ